MMIKQLIRTSILASGLLLVFLVRAVGLAQAATHWPASISGPTGFQDLGKAITKDPGFPAKGSEAEKARFVFSKLPEIARTYDFEAGSGGLMSNTVIGVCRMKGDPEGADSLKGWSGWGNCGEWSYAFSEILGGAGVESRVAYGDKKGGTGYSAGHGGTDTMVIVEERTPDGAISRRVFDPFRAAFHGTDDRPTAGTVAAWSDRPLTDNDKLPRDAGQTSWQSDPRINKPFIKDATSQSPLPPHEPIDVQTQRLRDRREAGKKKAEEEQRRKEEEARKRQEAEEAQRKAALDAAIKQANELVAAARAAAGRAQAAIANAKAGVAAGSNASSAAGTAEGAAQQAKGGVDAARSACARVVSEGVIDAARARAEAAASEVGGLYQETMDLASQTCQAAAQVQKAANVDARRILATKTEALAARAQSRAASAQGALGRAQAEAAQAARQNADRHTARQQGEAAKATLAAAQSQVSATEGVMNGYEASVTSAQGQMAAARTEIGQMEQNKKAAMGVLAPFLSEPQAQMLVPVINGVVAPSVDGLDQQLQSSLTTIQQARGRIQAAQRQLAAWGGSFAACDALAPTDGLSQAATAAASAAELFSPRIAAAAARAADCAGSAGGYDAGGDPGMGGSKPDTKGATGAGQTFQQGSPGAGTQPSSGATGGGPPVAQPGLLPGPTEAGTGGQQPPQQGYWCYSEKSKEWYWIPMGPCPPPHMKPPPTTAGEPGRIPWQGLVPPGETVAPASGKCPPGCHIKPGTGKCHCGGM
jgi:hypothetical protein